jgi:protein TonB
LSPPPNLPEPPKIEGQPSPAAVRPVETPGGTPPPPPTQVPEPTPQTTQAPAEQPPIPAPTEPVRVGGNVQQAKVVRQVSPVYPPLARQARVAGVVRVEATIGKDGKVLKAAALNGPPLLRQAAADAVRQWIYRPTTLNNQPVEVVTQIDVTFNLNR